MTDTSTYDPDSPAVAEFNEHIGIVLNQCQRGALFAYPWAEGSDSPLMLSLKARWRAIRGLPEEPLPPQIY